MKGFVREMHLPTVAVTIFSVLVELVTGMAAEEAKVAKVTCRATFDEGTGAGVATRIDAVMLGILATTLAIGGGATMAE
jgi:hypothetical protein